jgi:hypothetical protein
VKILAIIVASMLLVGMEEVGPGKCCKAAQQQDKVCKHKCCVKAAKKGEWCKVCGGSGKIPKKG